VGRRLLHEIITHALLISPATEDFSFCDTKFDYRRTIIAFLHGVSASLCVDELESYSEFSGVIFCLLQVIVSRVTSLYASGYGTHLVDTGISISQQWRIQVWAASFLPH